MKLNKLKIDDSDFFWVRGTWPAERNLLLGTLELASELSYNNPAFVELGTFKGINARNFIVALNKLGKQCRFFSVDFNPWNKRLHFYPKEEWQARCDSITGTCVQGFLEGKTIDRVKDFSDGEIAWLFVDACHCFECVRDEIKLYTPKLMIGGYMIFHDTMIPQNEQWVTHDPARSYGVKRAINQSVELKNQFKLICQDNTHHGTQVWRRIK
jgi:hypothetical protein